MAWKWLGNLARCSECGAPVSVNDFGNGEIVLIPYCHRSSFPIVKACRGWAPIWERTPPSGYDFGEARQLGMCLVVPEQEVLPAVRLVHPLPPPLVHTG